MTPRSMLVTGTLLLLLVTLATALHDYDRRQQGLTLEGNRLHSSESFEVSGRADEIIEQIGSVSADARALKDLSADGRVRAILTTTDQDLALPLHAGSTFSSPGQNRALVGADVDLTYADGSPVFVFDGREYDVVGYLGARADSLLSDDVLLSGPGLFSETDDEQLVIDGRGAFERYVDVFGSEGAHLMDGGTNRRTNIDFVSPLLLRFGFCTVLVGCAFTGSLAAATTRRRTRLLHVLGSPYGRLFALDLVRLVTLWIVCTSASMAFWGLTLGDVPSRSTTLAPTSVWQVTALVCAFAATFVSTHRKGTRWS